MRIKIKSMDEIEAKLLVLCTQSLKSMELVKEAIRERCRNHTFYFAAIPILFLLKITKEI